MFSNQFIFYKIKFLVFLLQKNYFSNLNRVWNGVEDTRYPTGIRRVRDEIINFNLLGIGYGYANMLGSRNK